MAVLSSLSLRATLLSLLALAIAQPPQFQSARPQPLCSDLTCDAESLAPLPSDPAIYRPWTHEPYCIHPAEKPLLAFCVLTNAEYHGGTSIVTLPELGMHMANRTGMAMGPGRAGAVRVGGEDEQDGGEGNVKEMEKKYEERVVEGKGRALFLKEGESLKAGEVVLVDYPSLLVAKDAMEVLLPEERYRMNWLGVMQLPDEGRAVVRGLTSSGRYADEVDNIVAMNALAVQYGGFQHMGAFPEAAKANHDCRPNLYYRFDDSTLSLSLFALRDISPGEELTYTYLDPLATPPHKDRQAALSAQWDFTCTCPLCSDPATRLASDRRRESIRKLKAALSDAGQEPERIVGVCEKLLGLYEEEGQVGPRCMVAEIAAYAANRAGDWGEAARFAGVARGLWEVITGGGSAEVRRLEELIADPRAHESYQPGEGLKREEEEEGGGDAVVDAVREAMRGARRKAREGGVGGEEEEVLVEEAVRAALKGALSRDEL